MVTGIPKKSLKEFGGSFDVPSKQARLRQIEDQISSDPDFWNDPTGSAPVLKEKKLIENSLQKANGVRSALENLEVAIEMAEAGDEECRSEAHQLLTSINLDLTAMEVQSLLGGELDHNDAVVTINAGAGGTESCDWAAMLFRMYLRFAERQGWSSEIYDLQEGDEAGIKSATVGISGELAFGLLKAESGVHRLVRISPFDSNARRHTSFASIFVSPVVDDEIDIDINPADIRVDTYRASGAGGQHVNRTDSAVRMTHAPSGIVVQCQSQRSQHQNREQCLKLLKGALYERELEERRAAQQEVEAGKSEINFGSQIRSYVLHPYQMVKDHRTSFETSSPEAVLDGDLEGFINEFLISSKQSS